MFPIPRKYGWQIQLPKHDTCPSAIPLWKRCIANPERVLRKMNIIFFSFKWQKRTRSTATNATVTKCSLEMLAISQDDAKAGGRGNRSKWQTAKSADKLLSVSHWLFTEKCQSAEMFWLPCQQIITQNKKKTKEHLIPILTVFQTLFLRRSLSCIWLKALWQTFHTIKLLCE